MSVSISVNNENSFRDDLFERLAGQYLLRGTESILAVFLDGELQESVEKLQKEKDPDKRRKLLDKASAVPRFYYYHQLFQENPEDLHTAFVCFSEILCTVSKRSEPFLSEQKVSGDQKFDDLYRKLCFVLNGFKAGNFGAKSQGKSRTVLKKLLKEFCKSISDVQEIYEEELKNPNHMEMLEDLFSLFKRNTIHFRVHAFLYDNGYQFIEENTQSSDGAVHRSRKILKHNSLHPAEQAKDSGRARRVDKTMKLLEQCKSLLSVSSEDTAAMREKCRGLYVTLVERGMTEEEYGNLFIPILHDQLTGVALCIVGRDYFETSKKGKEYEDFKKNPISCDLLVLCMRYEDGMQPSDIFYEYADYTPGYALRGKAPKNFNPSDYFDSIYQVYLDAKNDARDVLMELEVNHLINFPGEIDSCFTGYFVRASDDESMWQEEKACYEAYVQDFTRKYGRYDESQ